MSTYAVFGATGNCGSALIQELLLIPGSKVHAYCRSKSKLAKMMPEALEKGRVEVFEGQLDNVEVFEHCTRGCKAVFLAVSTNGNTPGYSVAEDTTKTLLLALRRLRSDLLTIPKVVVLSSASLNDELCHNMNSFAHWAVVTCNSYIYEDLRQQERLLRAESSWVSTIFIKPGGLALDQKRGHKLDLEEQETFISYADLAAGMVEAANAGGDQYDMKNVTVQVPGGKATPPSTSYFAGLVIRGLLIHFMPWTHRILPTI